MMLKAHVEAIKAKGVQHRRHAGAVLGACHCRNLQITHFILFCTVLLQP